MTVELLYMLNDTVVAWERTAHVEHACPSTGLWYG